jgi:hypothetical protein
MTTATKRFGWFRDIPESDKSKLAARWMLADHAGKVAMAKEFGVAVHSFDQLFSSYGYLCPPSPVESYVSPLQATPECVLIMADTHTPVHDAEFVEHLVMLAHAWHADLGVLLGDFMEFSAFSTFISPPERTFKEEKTVGKAMLEWLFRWLPKLWWVSGNHEDRPFRRMFEHLDNEDLWAIMGGFPNLIPTPYHWCILGPDDVFSWQLEHPRNSSVIAGRVSVRMGNIFSDKNMVGSHGHLQAATWTEDGKRHAIDIGMCCDPDKMDWVSLKHTLRPRMNRGALILKRVGGEYKPYPLTPDSDFEALRRVYA